MGGSARLRPLLLAALLCLPTLVSAQTAAVTTLNSQQPDLLPEDCGRRQVQPEQLTKTFIVGPGNTTAYYGQFPWQARLLKYSSKQRAYVHQCGGIIITERYVVTAAHCVVNVAPGSLIVRVGDLRFGTRELVEQEFAVASYSIHSQYNNGPGAPNDLALLRLRLRIGPGIELGPYVQPACLPAADMEYETFLACEVSGWGKTAEREPISEVLRGVEVPLVSDEFCRSPEVYPTQFLPGRTFCSGPVEGGRDSCGGDSGGPLVCYDPDSDAFIAYGIVSSGDFAGCGRRPGLYTRLSGYADWLLARLQLAQDEDKEAAERAASASSPAAPAPASAPCGEVTFVPPASVGGALLTDSSQFPWLAGIYSGSTFHCGATIISERWLVTSVTCAPQTRAIKVRLGDVSQTDGGTPSPSSTVLEIEEIVHHPQYGETDSSPDIALLRVRGTIPFSDNIKAICLPSESSSSLIPPNKDLIFVGWGPFKRFGKRAPKWARLKLVDVNACQSNYSKVTRKDFFAVDTFCTKFVETSSELQCGIGSGDGGSSFMATVLDSAGVPRWHAVGLSVRGPTTCGSDQLPDMNVALGPHIDWIRSVAGLPAPVRPPDHPGTPCTRPDGAAGQCLPLNRCPGLQSAATRGPGLRGETLCGLDEAGRALLCCPGLQVECGRTEFSPPAEHGAALVASAAHLPWMVSLASSFRPGTDPLSLRCGGAVLSDRWIVTGASCINGKVFSLRFGDLNLDDTADDNPSAPPFELEIERIVKHPSYRSGEKSQDMALLKTKSKIPFSETVRPICLPPGNSLPRTGKRLIFAGWGAPKFGDNVSPLTLKWARLRVVDTGGCRASYSVIRDPDNRLGSSSFCTNLDETTEKFKCAVNLGDQGSIFMDVLLEGGIQRWYATGIAVAGIGCGSEQYPDINIGLGPSLDWIRSVIST